MSNFVLNRKFPASKSPTFHMLTVTKHKPMSTIEKTLKLERLYKLIKRQFVGNTDEYAAKLDISRSTLFNYIEELKIAGAEIEYSRTLRRFVFLNDFVFEIKIKSKTLSNEEMKVLCGGIVIKSIPSNFLYCNKIYLPVRNIFSFIGIPTPNIKVG